MTRKDYVLLAKAMHDASLVRGIGPATMSVIVSILCDALKSTNPSFNAGKFIDACKGLT